MSNPCMNTAAESAYQDTLTRQIDKAERFLTENPLADFEEQAWINFSNPDFCAVAELADAYPDAVAFALCRFAGLSRGYYTHNEIQIIKDELNVEAWIAEWIDREQKRLQEEAMERQSWEKQS